MTVFVILAYDVQQKHDAKMMKTVKKYLRPVQKSVYEGMITQWKLEHLKREIAEIVDPETDAVVIYRLQSEKNAEKEEIGVFIHEGRMIL